MLQTPDYESTTFYLIIGITRDANITTFLSFVINHHGLYEAMTL